MSVTALICIAAPAALGVREVALWRDRLDLRKVYYARAKLRAEELKRPLVVVGDPDGGPTNPGPIYGDMCVDLTGCPVAPRGVRADISKSHAIPMADDSAVVAVFCVLELVPDIDAAWKEIMRVAGSPKNVFVVAMQPSSFSAWFYRGVQWVITDAPPTADTIVYKSAQIGRDPIDPRKLLVHP